MPSCPACGVEVPEGEPFCTSCGASISANAPDAEAAESDVMVWSNQIPLATNRVVVRDLLLVLFIPALIAGVLFSLLTGAVEFLLLFGAIAAGLLILAFIVMSILQLGSGGGLDTGFFISSRGVAYKAGQGTVLLNLASTLGSAVGGSTAGMGTGLLAISSQANTIFWTDVRDITVNEGLRMIQIRPKQLVNPVPLYCTEENYPSVLSTVRKYAPKTAAITIR
jgi:hypothetical protein